MYLSLSLLSGFVLFSLFPFFPFTSIIAFLLIVILSIIERKYLAVPVILIGFLYSFIRYSPPIDFSSLSGEEVIIRGSAQIDPRNMPTGHIVNVVNVDAVALCIPAGAPLKGIEGREIEVISREGLNAGLYYEMTIRLGKSDARLNPERIRKERPFAYLRDARVLKEEHTRGSILTWFRGRRERLHEYLTVHIGGDSGAFISAITTGTRTTISEELKDAFGATGLTHILSISGTHFGFFATLLFGMFRIMITMMPYRVLQRLTLYVSPSHAAALASLPFVCSYLLISGASFPTVRSFIMILIFIVGILIGRKGFWFNSLLIAAIIICVWEPSAIFSVSFQLSFLAVFIIGLFLEEKRKDSSAHGRFSKVLLFMKESLLLSLTVSLGTAPLVAYYFHYLSVISPVSNLIITPLIGFILVPLSLFSGFVFICTGYYPIHTILVLATEQVLKGIRFFALIPLAEIKIPAFPLFVVIAFYTALALYAAYVLSRKGSPDETPFTPIQFIIPAFLCISLFVYFAFLLSERSGLTATFLDVGQGDASIIETTDRKTIIIDTGRTGREVESYLRFLGKRSIDVLIITHADTDHSGGAPPILRRFKVKELWDSGLLTYHEHLLESTIHRSLTRGDEARREGFMIQILHPYEGFYSSDSRASEGNDDSLVVKIMGKKCSILYTADVAEEAEEDMLHLGDVLKSDVLKVSHHGSRVSTHEDFLKAVSPVIAVISAGRDNPFGHPHGDTLRRLEDVRIYRTDTDGAIKLTEGETGFEVKTYRDFAFEEVRTLSGEWRNLGRLFSMW